MRACMRACVHARMHTRTHTFVHASIRPSIHRSIGSCTHAPNACARLRAHCSSMLARMHACTHKHAHATHALHVTHVIYARTPRPARTRTPTPTHAEKVQTNEESPGHPAGWPPARPPHKHPTHAHDAQVDSYMYFGAHARIHYLRDVRMADGAAVLPSPCSSPRLRLGMRWWRALDEQIGMRFIGLSIVG